MSPLVFNRKGASIVTADPSTSEKKLARSEIVFGWLVRLALAFIRSCRLGKLIAVIPFSYRKNLFCERTLDIAYAIDVYRNDRVLWVSSAALTPFRLQ